MAGEEATAGMEGNAARSTTSTLHPRAPSRAARVAPAGRAPTITTSKSGRGPLLFWIMRASYGQRPGESRCSPPPTPHSQGGGAGARHRPDRGRGVAQGPPEEEPED